MFLNIHQDWAKTRDLADSPELVRRTPITLKVEATLKFKASLATRQDADKINKSLKDFPSALTLPWRQDFFYSHFLFLTLFYTDILVYIVLKIILTPVSITYSTVTSADPVNSSSTFPISFECKPCAGSHSCHVFIMATAVLHPEDSVLLCSCLPSGS